MAPNLHPIDEAAWLLPDTEASAWLPQKRALMLQQRSEGYAAQPGSEEACHEASALVLAHLGRPPSRGLPSALEDAAAEVSDDLCIMQRGGSGDWCLTAASVCAPTFWRLQDKIGQSLGGLHGAVPGGDPELAGRVSRVFTAMRDGQIMERFNWTVQAGGMRFTPESAPLKLQAAAMRVGDARRALHLRVERQTIRKLTGTGAVLFTIRICLDPLEAVLSVPGAKEALSHAWTAAHPAIAAYKGWQPYQRLMEHVLA